MTSPIVTDLAHEDVNAAAGLTPPVHEPFMATFLRPGLISTETPRRGKHRVGSRAGLVPVSAMTGVHFPARRRRLVGAR